MDVSISGSQMSATRIQNFDIAIVTFASDQFRLTYLSVNTLPQAWCRALEAKSMRISWKSACKSVPHVLSQGKATETPCKAMGQSWRKHMPF
jgi:hypothetical protein